MLVVGLTGGIASGKSTVARMLAERGATILDADALVRELHAPGTEVHRAILDAFGPEILAPDGTLDRQKLAARIFADPEARRTLEAIVHPALVAEIRRRVDALRREGRTRLCVLEAALLVEGGRRGIVDRLVVVTAPEEEQVARLRAKVGLSEEEARRRLRAQLPSAVKAGQADHVLVNDGDLARLAGRVAELAEVLLREATAGQKTP
ncbi:MAG TPA: dephospho-CoA kinase [Candidatus Methylomirabilis sp.]|jgi:dephospho-CoA kinase|nr:dephospho-CoA kinase [Candidatus Methylomirabilis sp.]